MKSTENSGVRRITASLPQELVDGVDELKMEWGLRSRGAVLERLLEELFNENQNKESIDDGLYKNNQTSTDEGSNSNYNEDTAIVLISNSDLKLKVEPITDEEVPQKLPKSSVSSSSGINLPGFISKKTTDIRKSLKKKTAKAFEFDSLVNNSLLNDK